MLGRRGWQRCCCRRRLYDAGRLSSRHDSSGVGQVATARDHSLNGNHHTGGGGGMTSCLSAIYLSLHRYKKQATRQNKAQASSQSLKKRKDRRIIKRKTPDKNQMQTPGREGGREGGVKREGYLVVKTGILKKPASIPTANVHANLLACTSTHPRPPCGKRRNNLTCCTRVFSLYVSQTTRDGGR